MVRHVSYVTLFIFSRFAISPNSLCVTINLIFFISYNESLFLSFFSDLALVLFLFFFYFSYTYFSLVYLPIIVFFFLSDIRYLLRIALFIRLRKNSPLSIHWTLDSTPSEKRMSINDVNTRGWFIRWIDMNENNGGGGLTPCYRVS